MNLRRDRPLCVRASGCAPPVGLVHKRPLESTRLIIYTLANMAIGTVGGVAFIGAVNVAKFGLGAVGAALKASADDGEKEKTKDDRGKEPKEKKDGKWAYD